MQIGHSDKSSAFVLFFFNIFRWHPSCTAFFWNFCVVLPVYHPSCLPRVRLIGVTRSSPFKGEFFAYKWLHALSQCFEILWVKSAAYFIFHFTTSPPASHGAS